MTMKTEKYRIALALLRHPSLDALDVRWHWLREPTCDVRHLERQAAAFRRLWRDARERRLWWMEPVWAKLALGFTQVCHTFTGRSS